MLVEVTWIVDYKVHVCVLFGMFYVLFRLLVVCVVGGPWWLVLFLEFPVVRKKKKKMLFRSFGSD